VVIGFATATTHLFYDLAFSVLLESRRCDADFIGDIAPPRRAGSTL
jgi:hypothetical protein